MAAGALGDLRENANRLAAAAVADCALGLAALELVHADHLPSAGGRQLVAGAGGWQSSDGKD
jgi:hypothetical protein